VHVDQAPYRELHDQLLDTGEGSLLPRWLDAHGDREAGWLAAFGARRGDPVPPATVEDRWRLHALAVVVELLLLPFQHGDADGSDWPGPDVDLARFLAFVEGLGLEPFGGTDPFAPVRHEIVGVDQAPDDAEPLSVVGVEWPGLVLGGLVVQRAGVRVRGGRRHAVAGVAERSTLFWASRRKHRPCSSLMDGWGSNSRWRTGFRRDYVLGGQVHYNVDAREPVDLAGVADPARTELLTHRCAVTRDHPDAEPWPYDDVLSTPVTG
jgi:hypothetical protein